LIANFIIISYDISHIICRMHYVLSCLCMYVHLYFMSSTFCYWWHKCIHIKFTGLELFLLHKKFNHCTPAKYITNGHIFSQYSAEILMRGTCTKCVFIQKRLTSAQAHVQRKKQNIIKVLLAGSCHTLYLLWNQICDPNYR
jgi:hypothetical protein